MFIDLHMPVMSGIEASKMLTALESEDKIAHLAKIACTGGISEEEHEACDAAGIEQISKSVLINL